MRVDGVAEAGARLATAWREVARRRAAAMERIRAAWPRRGTREGRAEIRAAAAAFRAERGETRLRPRIGNRRKDFT